MANERIGMNSQTTYFGPHKREDRATFSAQCIAGEAMLRHLQM